MADNIVEKLNSLLGEKGAGEISKRIANNEKSIAALLKKIGEIQAEKRAEEEARAAAEAEAARLREEAEKKAAEEAEKAKRQAELAKKEAEEKEELKSKAPASVPAPASEKPAASPKAVLRRVPRAPRLMRAVRKHIFLRDPRTERSVRRDPVPPSIHSVRRAQGSKGPWAECVRPLLLRLPLPCRRGRFRRSLKRPMWSAAPSTSVRFNVSRART